MDKSLAYNSVWQVRADAWCRLEEAADGLNRPGTPALKESYTTAVNDLLTLLTPLEPYWAYPGPPQFARVQRLFAAGDYDKFARAVSRINRALTTDSYRSGEADTPTTSAADGRPRTRRRPDKPAPEAPTPTRASTS